MNKRSEGADEVALKVQPIGYVSTHQRVKFHARHQPLEIEEETSVLELVPGRNFEQALKDLEGFSRVWLIWWFHRNATWRTRVTPPRGASIKRGVFATRSPHRPNPIGLTPVQLLGIKGRKLILGSCDLVDGTPVFDIKPYIPAYDAFPEASAGWTEEVEEAHTEAGGYHVRLSPLAETQAQWLRSNWQIDFQERLVEILARDPSPHRTRRIRKRGESKFVIGCGAWRAHFEVIEKEVEVQFIDPAYPLRSLLDLDKLKIPDHEAQMAYLKVWPEVDAPAR